MKNQSVHKKIKRTHLKNNNNNNKNINI